MSVKGKCKRDPDPTARNCQPAARRAPLTVLASVLGYGPNYFCDDLILHLTPAGYDGPLSGRLVVSNNSAEACDRLVHGVLSNNSIEDGDSGGMLSCYHLAAA